MDREEKRSFVAEDGEALPEDALYWANLFRARPGEILEAMRTIEDHPEPEDPTKVPRAMSGEARPGSQGS